MLYFTVFLVVCLMLDQNIPKNIKKIILIFINNKIYNGNGVYTFKISVKSPITGQASSNGHYHVQIVHGNVYYRVLP